MSVEGGAAPTLSASCDDMSQHEGLFARGGYQLLSIISSLALLLLWDVLVRLGVIDARFFPAPSTLATTLWAMAKSGELWSNTEASLIRLFWGFLVGASRRSASASPWACRRCCAPSSSR
jgi:hypothetical protein